METGNNIRKVEDWVYSSDAKTASGVVQALYTALNDLFSFRKNRHWTYDTLLFDINTTNSRIAVAWMRPDGTPEDAWVLLQFPEIQSAGGDGEAFDSVCHRAICLLSEAFYDYFEFGSDSSPLGEKVANKIPKTDNGYDGCYRLFEKMELFSDIAEVIV